MASSNIGVLGPSSPSRPPIMSSPCQQIRNPVCNAAPTGAGGPCNVASQQCCAQRPQRVCRQVPVRTIRKIKQMIPGRQTWKRECRTVPYNRTVVSYKTEYQTVEEFREDEHESNTTVICKIFARRRRRQKDARCESKASANYS